MLQEERFGSSFLWEEVDLQMKTCVLGLDSPYLCVL